MLTAAQQQALSSCKSHVVAPEFAQEHASTIKRISNGAVAIQFYPERILDQLLKDGCYRNAFETGASSGSNSFHKRKEWEDALFAGTYAESPATERVKYAFLHGFDRVRMTYGDSLIILKEDVKKRCTVTIGDSSAGPTPYRLTDPSSLLHDAKAVYRDSKWQFSWGYDTYLEVQVHGGINLATDVDRVLLNEEHHYNREIERMAEKLALTYNVPVQWKRIHT